MLPLTVATVPAIRAIEILSPRAAARLARPLFMNSRPARAVRPHEMPVHDQARRSIIQVRGRSLAVFEWGWGPRTILLVHGWRGRASQFAPLVRELRSEGFKLIAFDAPANGDSSGRRTDIRDWLAAIDALQGRYGRFHAIVGHSFGSLAAVTAVREGVEAASVVSIAGMPSARYLVDAFASRVGLSSATAEALGLDFAHRVMPGEHPSDFWHRFDVAKQPLPKEVPLLVVHDIDDKEVPSAEAERLHAANGARSRLVSTSQAGHTRVLGADTTLDAVLAFASNGLVGVDRMAHGSRDATPAAV